MNVDILKYYQLDLQFFASAEDEGRTEPPSERRRREKRDEGEVPKSMELNSAFVFTVTLIALIMTFHFLLNNIISMAHYYLTHLNKDLSEGVNQAFEVFSIFFWRSVGTVLFIAALAGVIINIFQIGFFIAPKALTPKMNRIAFTFKKLSEKILLSKAVLMNLLFSLMKIIILLILFIGIIFLNIKDLLNLSGLGLENALSKIFTIIEEVFVSGGCLLIFIGIFEYFFKKQQFEDSLKVTRSESKRELKQDEGDPQFKGYLKEMYNRLLQQKNIRKRIPEADVVITNPTHFAVALKYDMDSMDAPMVIAKGEDDTALLIRELAQEHYIEIIENPPLARELYKLLNVGDFIPEHLTMIIAEIFVELYQSGKWKTDQEVNKT